MITLSEAKKLLGTKVIIKLRSEFVEGKVKNVTNQYIGVEYEHPSTHLPSKKLFRYCNTWDVTPMYDWIKTKSKTVRWGNIIDED